MNLFISAAVIVGQSIKHYPELTGWVIVMLLDLAMLTLATVCRKKKNHIVSLQNGTNI